MRQGTPRQTALLVSPVRRRIVDTLAALPLVPSPDREPGRTTGLTATEVGQRLGLHVTSARFHLEQLLEAGVVSAGFHRHGPGRPQKRYAAVPGLDPPPREESFRMLAELLTDAIAPVEGATGPEDAGLRWSRGHVRPPDGPCGGPLARARTAGQWLGKVGLVVDLLESWGYEPSLRTGDRGRTAEVAMARCPFLELAARSTEVVCLAHRGVLRGALEVFAEPDAGVEIDPFVAPGLCVARLRSPGLSTSEAPVHV